MCYRSSQKAEKRQFLIEEYSEGTGKTDLRNRNTAEEHIC